MDTKTCSITEDEIKSLIMLHGSEMREDDIEASLERMNYLFRRLKAEKKEVEVKAPPTMTDTQADAIGTASKGW